MTDLACGWCAATSRCLRMDCRKSGPCAGFHLVQPDLTDNFGVPFRGEAKTITGDIWWHEQDGKRYPLRPVNVIAGRLRND